MDAIAAVDGASSSGAGGSGSPAAAALDRHPERRVKAAYAAYEEEQMPKLRAENPSLRHTQLQQLLWKQWTKAPENPMNQAHVAHDATASEAREAAKSAHGERMELFRTNSQSGNLVGSMPE